MEPSQDVSNKKLMKISPKVIVKKIKNKGYARDRVRNPVTGRLNSVFKCLVCSRVADNKFSIEQHLRTHLERCDFFCKNCGKGFTQKCNMMRHYQNKVCTKKGSETVTMVDS